MVEIVNNWSIRCNNSQSNLAGISLWDQHLILFRKVSQYLLTFTALCLPFWLEISFLQKPNKMKSKVFAFPVFTFGTSVTPRIFWILWISLKGSQNLYKWSVQDRHILAFSQVGWYVDPFQIGGIFHNGRKSHWRAQISRRRLCAQPGFPSRPTCIENINEKLILKTKQEQNMFNLSVYFWSWSCRTVQETGPSNFSIEYEILIIFLKCMKYWLYLILNI